MTSDNWETEGVTYTIDTTKGPGAILTAQRQSEVMIYSRIVPNAMSRQEVEKLFELQLVRSF